MNRANLSDAQFDATLPTSAGGSGRKASLDTSFGASIERPFTRAASGVRGAGEAVGNLFSGSSGAPRRAAMTSGVSESRSDLFETSGFAPYSRPSKPIGQMSNAELHSERVNAEQSRDEIQDNINQLQGVLNQPTAEADVRQAIEYGEQLQGQAAHLLHPKALLSSPSLKTYGGTSSSRVM